MLFIKSYKCLFTLVEAAAPSPQILMDALPSVCSEMKILDILYYL